MPNPRPDYVQNFEKPRYTEIKGIRGQWYLYECAYAFDPKTGRTRKISGPMLGIIRPDGFHPTRRRRPRSSEETSLYQQCMEDRASRNLPPRSKELEEWLEKASEGFPPPSISERPRKQKKPAEKRSQSGPSDDPEEQTSEEPSAALPGSAPTGEECLLDPTLPDTDASPEIPPEDTAWERDLKEMESPVVPCHAPDPSSPGIPEMPASPASPDHAPCAVSAESSQTDRLVEDRPATLAELNALRQDVQRMEGKIDHLFSLLTQVLAEVKKDNGEAP